MVMMMVHGRLSSWWGMCLADTEAAAKKTREAVLRDKDVSIAGVLLITDSEHAKNATERRSKKNANQRS
jgi:hypothetical protein